jgi:hypothetical protein
VIYYFVIQQRFQYSDYTVSIGRAINKFGTVGGMKTGRIVQSIVGKPVPVSLSKPLFPHKII